MKIKYLAIAAAIFFCSCKNEQKETVEQTETAKQATDAAQATSMTPEWEGIYTGTTPCPEPCKGEETKMQLNADSTYTLSVQAIGQEDKPRIFSGRFYWDTAKNIITLDENGDHHKFLVQEGSLKELDKFGDLKQLGKQEDYILKKQ